MTSIREPGPARRIRVVFIQRTIPPDPSAAGKLLLDLASALDPHRFDVTILATRVPGDALRDEMVGTVRIRRAGGRGFSRRSLAGRLRGLLGAWVGLVWAAMRLPRMDVVVTLTDPPLSVALGAAVAGIRGFRHVHWAQDMYPEVAVAGGVVPEGQSLHRMLEAIANAVTPHCHAVVAIGRCMAERFRRRGVAVTVVPNWSGIDASHVDDAAVAEYRKVLGGDGAMVALYSGNLGIVHDFETLLDAAELLRDRGAKVVVGIVGDGPRGDWLRGEVARRRLANVRWLPAQAWAGFPSLLAAADAHLVTLRAEFAGLVVPSKLYDAAASGRPVLMVGPEESETALAIRECDCGAVVPNGAAELLADRLELWSLDPAQRVLLGRNATKLPARFPKAAAVARFEQVLADVSDPSEA